MQGPAIDSAHELGCTVTAIDGNPNAVCKNKADFFEHIDLKDTQAIIDFALKLKSTKGLAAVFTAGTDFSYAIACTCEACGLPNHSPQAAKNASDKIIMRSCFEKHSVPSPQYMEVSSQTPTNSVSQFLKALSYPLVVKPCDNMGGRGCRLVHSDDELSVALADAIKYSKTGRAIVEEYMEGPEFSIDSLIFDGELTITGFADRHIFYPPYFIEMGHTMPTSIDTDSYEQLLKTFALGVKSLGLRHGAAKGDIKLTPNGPMIGEIAARLSGGYMSGWTYPYASNINLTKQALLLALGEKPENLLQNREIISFLPQNTQSLPIYNLPCVQHSAERAWLSIPGIIQSTEYFDKAATLFNIKNFFPRLQKGDKAVFPVNNVEKAGNVISCATTRNEACESASLAVKTVFLRLQTSNPETNTFLAQVLNTAFPPSAFTLPQHIIEKKDNFRLENTFSLGEQITLPSFLQNFANLKDWNGRSLSETIELFNHLAPSKKSASKEKSLANNATLPNFWHCFIRGGIQGALYYADAIVED